MRHRQRTLGLFALSAAAVMAAMTWLTLELRALEHREAIRRAQGAQRSSDQTSIRTALWRMDSFLAPLLGQEAARPYFHYSAFYSPDVAFTEPYATMACKGDVIEPSPLLTVEPEFCLLHFQVSDTGAVTSPRLPADPEKRNEAWHRGLVAGDEMIRAEQLLSELLGFASGTQILAIAEAAPTFAFPSTPFTTGGDAPVQAPPQIDAGSEHRHQFLAQRELAQRQQTAYQALNIKQTFTPQIESDAAAIHTGPLTPLFVDGANGSKELLLVRTVDAAGGNLVQGVWMDWPRLRSALLERAKDLMAQADLVPGSSVDVKPDQLAGIPAVLIPGPVSGSVIVAETPIRTTIYVAWAGVIAALFAIALTLLAIIELGERRGRFVSAVTHELRTPLTTFCLYSELLADGMVRDDAARKEYYGTLKRESRRLARIVENVLCYARLAEVRSTLQTESVDAGELLDRIIPAISRRVAESGMTVESEFTPVRGYLVEVDAQTVERVLANLVDNACKYARGHPGSDPRIHVWARPSPGRIEIHVADHGPGIPRSQRKRIFRAFRRTTEAQQSTAPGLGLGLALARGLARELGGDLRLLPPKPGFGAILALTIPAAEPAGLPRLAKAGA